jgi:hypothetical protein
MRAGGLALEQPVTAEFGIGLAAVQDVVGDHQDRVGHGDRGAFVGSTPASVEGDLTIVRREEFATSRHRSAAGVAVVGGVAETVRVGGRDDRPARRLLLWLDSLDAERQVPLAVASVSSWTCWSAPLRWTSWAACWPQRRRAAVSCWWPARRESGSPRWCGGSPSGMRRMSGSWRGAVTRCSRPGCWVRCTISPARRRQAGRAARLGGATGGGLRCVPG